MSSNTPFIAVLITTFLSLPTAAIAGGGQHQASGNSAGESARRFEAPDDARFTQTGVTKEQCLAKLAVGFIQMTYEWRHLRPANEKVVAHRNFLLLRNGSYTLPLLAPDHPSEIYQLTLTADWTEPRCRLRFVPITLTRGRRIMVRMVPWRNIFGERYYEINELSSSDEGSLTPHSERIDFD